MRVVPVALALFLCTSCFFTVKSCRTTSNAFASALSTWDFSHSRSPAVVGWPESYKDQFWLSPILQEFHLILPDGTRLHFSDVAPVARRSGNRIDQVNVTRSVGSIDDAIKLATEAANRWGIDRSSGTLEDFRASVVNNPNYPRDTHREWQGIGETCVIVIRCGSGLPGKLWHVELNFSI
jgi:hypothetical protein